ncbi:LRR receptor-like serine/threonine-protein kinase FLS2 [Prosopis cineraria]|uniref:LRR receptor-like serine/threonine-protein kinase FLS2 n=1 Tax=Prosopis cineraria TaxID=364024 RepID=UPI002410049F|nr:LRR receptor-like serine/threonine-protein kinase FLS2 [Prosopis cineraria]
MGKSPSFVLLIFSINCFISSLAWISTSATADKSALLGLESLISSDPYDSLSTWSLSSSPCNWVGVTCNTNHGRVRSLNLGGMDLQGTISLQLGNLSFLVELDLRSNNFYGQIPRELVQLHRLKLLNFSCNDFHGQVPSWIGDLSTLEHLDLRNNSFDGLILLSLFNLSRMETLDWNFNLIEGPVPNELSSSMLTSLFNSSVRQYIELANNNLQGFIPKEIGNLVKPEVLDLRSNHLSGSITFNGTSLAYVLLEDNFTAYLQDNQILTNPNTPPQVGACRLVTPNLHIKVLSFSLPSAFVNTSAN